MTSKNLYVNDMSRLWLIPYRAGPANVPTYQGWSKVDMPAWNLGEARNIYVPSATEYQQFDVAGQVIGERGSPSLSIMSRFAFDVQSQILKRAKQGCQVDLQVHIGQCADPQDFNKGWEKIIVLEGARASSIAIPNLSSLEPSERGAPTEDASFIGEDLYEIVRQTWGEQAEAQVVQSIIDILICDKITCGACGIPSDGCMIVFALTLTAGGSPGLPAEVLFTDDGGLTWDDTNVSTLAANEDPNAMACIGLYLVVISEDSASLHYAPLADILAGIEVWTEVTTGFIAANGPLAMVSLGPRHTWIVGETGYIYFTDDPTAGVEVQNAGIATIENLNAIHGSDINHLVAVGANNAVVVTSNGGVTWAAITGPAVGVALNTVWMKSALEWFIGTAGGRLFYTRDGGETWTEKGFPGSGAGVVRHIAFANNTVGFMSHDTATPRARLFKTVDGGNSWYIAPEGNTAMPLADRFNRIAPCTDDPNITYAGGLADDGTDGMIVKGAGPVSV